VRCRKGGVSEGLLGLLKSSNQWEGPGPAQTPSCRSVRPSRTFGKTINDLVREKSDLDELE